MSCQRQLCDLASQSVMIHLNSLSRALTQAVMVNQHNAAKYAVPRSLPVLVPVPRISYLTAANFWSSLSNPKVNHFHGALHVHTQCL